MLNRVLATLGLLGVAACGGSSSSGPTVVPVSATGFATANSAVTGGDSFEVDLAIRTLEAGDGTYVIDRQDISYSISADAQQVTLTIAGEDYITTFNGNTYVYNENGNFVSAQIIDGRVPEAVLVEVFALIDEQLNSSLLVIGDDTNPTEIAALSGTATMNGTIFIDARNESGDGFASGPLELNVDFNANSVSGDFSLEDDGFSAAEFTIPSSSFSLNATEIVGNGFEGSISQTSGDLEGTLSDAVYSGRFFGQNAPTAGGQIGAVVTADDDSTTVITGGFIAVN